MITHLKATPIDPAKLPPMPLVRPLAEITRQDGTVVVVSSSVSGSWQQAESFVRAISSRGLGATVRDVLGFDNTKGHRVSKAVFTRRVRSCFGNGKSEAACPNLSATPEGRRYCRGCGCGSAALALLDDEFKQTDYKGSYTKLMYPALECPLRRPGFKNSEVSLP